MKRVATLIRTACGVGSVLAILALGASQLLAGPVTRSCPPSSIGTCTSQQDCQNQCDVVFPPPGSTGGLCNQGCCYCAF